MTLMWARASYPKESIDLRSYITTMEFVGVSGVYNVYRLSDGTFVTTFNNQPSIRNYVDLNLGSIFLLRLLKSEDVKHSYPLVLDKKLIVAYTIARIVVLVQGSEETPRKLHYNSDRLAYIE